MTNNNGVNKPVTKVQKRLDLFFRLADQDSIDNDLDGPVVSSPKLKPSPFAGFSNFAMNNDYGGNSVSPMKSQKKVISRPSNLMASQPMPICDNPLSTRKDNLKKQKQIETISSNGNNSTINK